MSKTGVDIAMLEYKKTNKKLDYVLYKVTLSIRFGYKVSWLISGFAKLATLTSSQLWTGTVMSAQLNSLIIQESVYSK